MAQSYRAGCPLPQVPGVLACVVIADDLTGACDAAAPFRARGASVHVQLESAAPSVAYANVLAFTTDSRDLPAAEMRERVLAIAARVKRQPASNAILFKKIDSTLRGNPGAEIAVACEAFDCELAVIAPGFPEMGRQVLDGFLQSDRDPAWRALHVPGLLRSQGLEDCHHAPANAIDAALSKGNRFVSLDTTSNEDLESIVSAALRCGRRVLWAGSAGLASALAAALFPGEMNHTQAHRVDKPVLFAIGSNHVVTAAQSAELRRCCPVQQSHADATLPPALVAALTARQHVLLTIGRDTTQVEELRTLLHASHHLIGAFLLSGGDTASLVCRAIAATGITLEGEVVRGLPWGLLQGGAFHGVPVATKSGAFGDPHALIEVADFFSCLGP